ncbi:MAG: SCO family protein [Crocinitomicaceae bacterium]|nr:SCO family protein [Crocinitomicaceae bacterium]
MKKRVLFLMILFVVGVFTAYFISKPSTEKILPVYNPIDVNEEMVDPELARIGYGHTIGDFSFLDQNGKVFTQEQVKGKVYVVEYFFTTCGTICPKMNAQMQRIQQAYKNSKKVALLSFTVNPETDTVEQLKRYAIDHEANDQQWHFLTGKQEKLYQLARTSFFVLKPAEVENQGDEGSDFIHTNNFVLVDQSGRIRGYYDGTSTKEVNQLIKDIQLLLN